MRGMTNRTGYFALGVFHTAPVVGIFFFAYNLSSQTLRIVTFSLSRVMMPIFAHLNDEPRRQLRGCLRASESLVALGLVFCLLQAAVAEPLFRLVFGPKWDAAVPVFQFLCIGLAMRMPEATALSLLKGRGEFRRFYWLCQISFLVFLSAALLTAWLGGPRLVAVAVLVWAMCFGVTTLSVAIRCVGGRVSQAVLAYARPLLAVGPAMAIGWAAAQAVLGESVPMRLAQILVSLVVGVGLSLGLLRLTSPVAREVMSSGFAKVIGRLKRGSGAVTA